MKYLRRSKIIFNESFLPILDDFAKKVDERTFLFMLDGKPDKIEKSTITADHNKGCLKMSDFMSMNKRIIKTRLGIFFSNHLTSLGSDRVHQRMENLLRTVPANTEVFLRSL